MFNFSFGKDSVSDSNVFLRKIQQQTHDKLLEQEQVYEGLRRTGLEASATILNILDTGVRNGDNASVLHFDLEVHPERHPAFRSETQNAIPDGSRPRFMTGVSVIVKYNPDDLSMVAYDRADFEAARSKVMTCPHCGSTQTLQDGQSACAYCGRPI